MQVSSKMAQRVTNSQFLGPRSVRESDLDVGEVAPVGTGQDRDVPHSRCHQRVHLLADVVREYRLQLPPPHLLVDTRLTDALYMHMLKTPSFLGTLRIIPNGTKKCVKILTVWRSYTKLRPPISGSGTAARRSSRS